MVTLTGISWGSGESVHIVVNDDKEQPWSFTTDVNADSSGGFVVQLQLPTSFAAAYAVKAVGASGAVATTTFTDGNVNIKTIGVASASVSWTRFTNGTCSGSGTASGTINATSGGNGTAIPAGAGSGESLRLTAGALTNFSFASWSVGNFTSGDPSTVNPVCLVGDNNTQNIRLTYAGATDTTPPAGALISINGGAAWTNSAAGAVTLSFSATDNVGVTSYRLAQTQAGLASATDVVVSPAEASFTRSGVAFTLTGAEAASKEVWLRVCDAANNCSDASDSIGWDKTVPTFSCAAPASAWSASDVSRVCTAADTLSGLNPSSDSAFSLSTNVPSGTETADAQTGSKLLTDLAGNSATAGPLGGNKVDKKAPTFSCAGPAGSWSAADVSRACTAADGGSGLNPASDSSFSLSTNVLNGTEDANSQTGSKVLSDAVGNAVTSGPLGGNKVDKKAPTFDCEGAPAAWSASDVSRGCAAADGGSGLSPASDDHFSLSTDVQAGTETDNAQTGSKVLTDGVGHTTTVGPLGGNKVDKKNPQVSCGSADGAWHANDVAIALYGQRWRLGLADAGDASFRLATSVPADSEDDNASTNSRDVRTRLVIRLRPDRSAATRSTRRRRACRAGRRTASGTRQRQRRLHGDRRWLRPRESERRELRLSTNVGDGDGDQRLR